MFSVKVHKAKTDLSRLLKRVAQGEEIVIARARKPVARLIPVALPRPASRLGIDKSNWKVPEDFNEPLPQERIEGFWNHA